MVPLKITVGLGLTVIIALLLRSPGIDAHLLSLAANRVYVLLVAGVTITVYGLAKILLTVTGVVPSV